MITQIYYRLYYWWGGDNVSAPSWVRVDGDDMDSPEDVIERQNYMIAKGWKSFKIIQYTVKEVSLETVKRAITKPKRNASKKK